jgi:hypothetical protein
MKPSYCPRLRSIVPSLALALSALAGAASCRGTEAPARRDSEMSAVQPWAPPSRLAAPAELHPLARQMVRERMADHGRHMTQLVWAVVALDLQRAGELGGRIAADADLARPVSDDATHMNALLPAGFFELQDQLRYRAGLLAAASLKGDAGEVSRAYGALSETCVACHAVYRDGSPTSSAR